MVVCGIHERALAFLLLCITADFGGSSWLELNFEDCWPGACGPLVASLLLLAIAAPLPLRQILNELIPLRLGGLPSVGNMKSNYSDKHIT